MDFSSIETWIDLLVVLIAVVAVIVGAVTIARMFKQEDAEKKSSSDTQPVEKKKTQQKVDKKPSKPVFDKITKEIETQSPKETVVQKLDKKFDKPFVPKPADKPKVAASIPNTKVGKTTMPSSRVIDSAPEAPKLDAIQLSLDTPEKLLLKLKNNGDKLIYKKIKTGDHNELDIRYEPPARAFSSMREEFPNKSVMTFSLSGQAIISKTYHFTIYYSDMHGNLYTQIIAGMGKEYPIVDMPRKIA